jgi:hypothetical protein
LFELSARFGAATVSPFRPSGGRTWWAHFEYTRIKIEPIILYKKIEDVRESGAT